MRSILCLVAFAACTNTGVPTPTGATCPDANNPQFTWQNFGYDFMCHYCTNCHDSSLTLNQRNGAPLFHDFDTLFGVMEVANHTDEYAAAGPHATNTLMPGGGTGGRCPSMLGGPLDMPCLIPTEQERQTLGVFLACEVQRPQDYQGSDALATDHCASYTGPR